MSRHATTFCTGILVLALLSAGCTGTISGGQTPGPDGGIQPGSTAVTAAGGCIFGGRAGSGDPIIVEPEPCYFETHSPVEYLHDLRTHPEWLAVVPDVPEGWISTRDTGQLMQEIDSTEPAAPVISPISSYRPFNRTSTVGNEAMFLLEGYREGRYPPALCSLDYFHPNRTEMRVWWENFGKMDLPDEREAIRIVKDANPDLRDFTWEPVWPRSIMTERDASGWYVAFIMEGSGVPIVSARCYHVGNDRTVSLTGSVNRSTFVLPRDFSPARCG